MTLERKKGAKGTARTELVAVRFDPKTRYLMELAARAQRRSVANYVEWAVDESLKNVSLHWEGDNDEGEERTNSTIAFLADTLWDVDETNRFFYLATAYRHLLTHEEQVLWKLMRDTDALWVKGASTGKGDAFKPNWPAMRAWFPAAKFAVSSGADLATIRAALNGDGAAVEAIGLDKFAQTNLPAKKSRKAA